MFVRLTILRPHARSLQPEGLFGPAYALRREGRCPPGFEDWLDDALGWLEGNLTSPDFWEPRAVFWMRCSRQGIVERMWALAVILREADEHVQVVTTGRPGYIVYEDRAQVAAIPFRDTFRATFRGR